MVGQRHFSTQAIRRAEGADRVIGRRLLIQPGGNGILPALPQVAVQLLREVLAVAFPIRRAVKDRVDMSQQPIFDGLRLVHSRAAEGVGSGRGSKRRARRTATTFPLGVRL